MTDRMCETKADSRWLLEFGKTLASADSFQSEV